EMKVVAVPKPQWGNFYRGDAYIVYSCLEIKGRLEQHVHFWLGSGCSQDESTVAAFKTVELDDLCGGAPVQHREVEGNESLAFLAYFKKGIKYNEGGVKSGLSHVDRDSHEPKLYQVKGKRSPRCRQVPMEWSSFNSGDVFINDQGPADIRLERHRAGANDLKAMEVARSLRDERSSAELLVLEEGEESTLEGEQKEVC
uniref:Gelsolin-like domain-containing protein n=1 Tax=Macrostomum lignano TaxID=282301 RepID=A0A1I8JRJ9_9PLAT